jgi:pyruvate dehydrogenase E2 component (dihydrolipoamide acetyltransferase)
MSTIEVKVPDIGDFKDVPVIEVLVKPGDAVKAEDSLVTLESDKATMDVPSPSAGTVKDLKVKPGDKVSEGSVILTLDSGAPAAAPKSPPDNTSAGQSAQPAAPQVAKASPQAAASQAQSARAPASAPAKSAAPTGAPIEVKVPDIGDFKDVPVIEVLVKPGDAVKPEDALVTLESDKATMDVPSPSAGTVKEIKVKLGDKVSEGSVILTLDASAGAAAPTAASTNDSATAPSAAAAPEKAAPSAPAPSSAGEAASAPKASAPVDSESFRKAHASPSVRAFARELGVDLSRVEGTGPKGRILQGDVQKFVKQAMSGASGAPSTGAAGGAALGLLPWPQIDFSKFGPVETKPLTRIKKISGANLHRNWVMIPHVTNHDDADITDLEAFRVRLNKENEKSGIKVTMLTFLIKACVAALKQFPDFNASLDGDNLIYKKYYNIGFAADTPGGLVVPVIKNADQKGLMAIAKEMADLSAKAREGKLGPADMQGGCFSISSLGGIGGTYFTPIINAPEVAILGVCRSSTRPVWDGKEFTPRLILPLSLSWDHRVIDGASAARFNSFLIALLGDMRRTML